MVYMKPLPLLSVILPCLLTALCSCRGDEIVPEPEHEKIGQPIDTPLTGFYLLNQGNMGANKASLDRYTFADGVYSRNVFASLNPEVAMELGDVGNAMRRYGEKLYIVVNCSNKVEVLDLRSGRRLGQIDIPNCRDIAFSGPDAYVTSYAGPVEISQDYSQRGFVARIDTLTLRETARCTVGYQPDGIAVSNGRIFVANSGGYRVPNYERTVSVIDLQSMQLAGLIEVAENLCHVLADPNGNIWVSSRGDYYDIPSRLYCIDAEACSVIRCIDIPVSAMWLHGDRLYTVSAAFNYDTYHLDKVFAVVDTAMGNLETTRFVTDGTEEEIRAPYGVACDPLSGDIYVCDARTYINPGYLYCFSSSGLLKWKLRTGDVPSHLVFF